MLSFTIFHSECADDIPADTSNVDPANSDPWLTGGCSVVLKEADEPAIGHATSAASDRRVVDDVDDTFLAYVSIRGVCAITARVDARFGTQTATGTQHKGRHAIDGHDLPDSCAEAVYRSYLGHRGRMVGFATFVALH